MDCIAHVRGIQTMTAETSPSLQIGKNGITTVSFALFGTLLLRRCTGIDGVYERTLHHAPVPQRLKLFADTFVQHRTLAQNKARIGVSGSDDQSLLMVSGVTIEAIYQQFAAHSLNLPKSILPQLIEAELKAEQDLALVNPEIVVLYNEARRLGRRVGVVAESHWSSAQIRTLLATVAPDLSFDFILSSADPEAIAAGGLFKGHLDRQKLDPAEAVHIGIDEDTIAQKTHGVTLVPYAIGTDIWQPRYKREEAAARMLAMSDKAFSWRLDGGLRLLRRVALTQTRPNQTHHAIGAAVLGPVMVGFQRLIEARVAELAQPGRKVRVAFLARDGYLPMRIWSAAGAGLADYVEVNRRIAIIAGTEGDGGFKTLQRLFSGMDFVTGPAVEQFFKIELTEKMKDFFAKYDHGAADAKEFAEAIPELFDEDMLPELSGNLRAALMEYLRIKIDDLDNCTDLILVDIGYTGNIQKGLRRVFDVEGLPIRLHGIYLMPHGESFAELPGEDSVCGYFDDTVMTPAAKRGLMRDAPLLEEFCCAPVGSTRGYVNGKEVREDEVRLSHEITFCLEMQDECIRYFDAFQAAVKRYGVDPLADFDNYRVWTAAILSRFVMMPNGHECQTFGPLLHDVSLGSKALIATITTADIRNLMGALPFPTVCSIHHPPVWLGGSMAAHNQAAGFAYAVTGLGLGTDDFFRDVEVGTLEAVIVKGERAVPVPVASTLTPFGDIRLRIPVLQRDGNAAVALPLKGPLARGVIRSVILQGGPDVTSATTTRYGERQSRSKIMAQGATLDGNVFRMTGPNAFLLFPVPELKQPVHVLTVLITPLFDE